MDMDMDGFDKAMAQQRAQSRSVTRFDQMNAAFTNLTAKGFQSEFVGYQQTNIISKVVLIVQNDEAVSEAGVGSRVDIVTEQTPFYGEAGGQVGDVGVIENDGDQTDLSIAVDRTIKNPTGLIILQGTVRQGRVKTGQPVKLAVDESKRIATARNHTATHILHTALRKFLGDHVKQAGSLVAPDRLRFDFTHFSQVDSGILTQIENYVNERIRGNIPVEIQEMDMEQAIASGATALFEEKYGDRVRVISLGKFSRELCGGTHCRRTGDIGCFQILSESSIASGVRRIEAVTGREAMLQTQRNTQTLQAIANLLKVKPDALADRVEKVLQQQKGLEKEIVKLKAQIAGQSAESITSEIEQINGISLVAKEVTVDQPGELRDLADKFKDKIQSGIVLLGSVSGSKALLIAVVTKDLTDRFHAGKIIKKVAAIVGGGGGGRPDMAQAGGTKPEKLKEAIASVAQIIKSG